MSYINGWRAAVSEKISNRREKEREKERVSKCLYIKSISSVGAPDPAACTIWFTIFIYIIDRYRRFDRPCENCAVHGNYQLIRNSIIL